MLKTKSRKRNLLFLFAATIFFASSCVTIKKQTAEKTKEGDYIIDVTNNYNLKLTTVIIDSCEYLIGGVTPNQLATLVMTHKGNCKFCEARHKRQP